MPVDRSIGPKRPPARAKTASLSVWFFARIFFLGCVAVIASFWGLVRFYTRVHPPMVVPAVRAVPAARQERREDAGSGGTELIPAPEIEVEGR